MGGSTRGAGAADFDLQSHSRHSDGALDPAEVVRLAARAGVRRLALTDHDSVAGVAEAIEAGRREGIAVVAGTELSAVHETHEDLHLLGYCIDLEQAALRDALVGFRADRRRRIGAMAQALLDDGWSVDAAALLALGADGDHPVGRPHLAAAVAAEPANARRMAAEGLADASALLAAYLLPGQAAYRPREYPSVREAIELIHGAGGVAVWAHPFWDLTSVAEVLGTVDVFASWGLDGVECFYPTHSAEQTRALAGAAADLLRTGSSDFHAPDHRLFADFLAFELHGCEPRLGPIGEG